MKKRIIFFGGILLVLGVLCACQKQDLYDSDSSRKVTDLVIPEGFDWTMTKEVSLKVISAVHTSVSVFVSENCSDNSLVAILPVSVDSKSAELTVPAGIQTVYVQYTKANGQKSILPVSLNIADTRSGADLEVKLPEGVGESAGRGKMCFYPSMSGYGTLLFEDSWPNLGDYDFNDLVARYQVVTTGDAEGVASMEIWVQLTALGGVFPYQLGLMLDGISTDDIASVQKGDEIGKWEMTSKGNESAVFLFNWENLKGLFGGKFYNTEKQYQVDFATWRKQVAYFTLTFKDKVKVSGNTFNFFINWQNRSEIHLMGYRPTDKYAASYNQVIKDNPQLLDLDTYYKNVKGFVWGLKVPESIAHAQEGVDFSLAYKNFASWVLSGGREYQDWYKQGDPAKLMPAME